MVRKVLVALGWVAGGLVGLCALLYVITLAINLKDAEPSPAARQMTARFEARPAASDADNAFVYVMGFGAPPDGDPTALGQRRIAWMMQADGTMPLDLDADPALANSGDETVRDPEIQVYLEACMPYGEGCIAAFEAAAPRFESWSASEGWLLERYLGLIALPAWREIVPTDISAPLPSYHVVMNGQKFLLLKANVLAMRGDATEVSQLLGRDLRFWRRALESSEILISKMIATTAINRNLKVGAAVLRALPPGKMPEATPPDWTIGLTDAERSMRRCMTGEWVYVSNTIRDFAANGYSAEWLGESSFDRATNFLRKQFLKPQDTINLNAELYARVGELLEGVSFANYEAATNRVAELSTQRTDDSRSRWSLYNPGGRPLVRDFPDFSKYARRVSDIEGVRRAALLAVDLHQARVKLDDMPIAIAASDRRNPYDGKPFAWDAAKAEIVFRGLTPGEGGEYRIQ